jgi:hypothetical protein
MIMYEVIASKEILIAERENTFTYTTGVALSQGWGVYADEIEFASQISISAQHEPLPPTPVLTLLVDGTHPSTFA